MPFLAFLSLLAHGVRYRSLLLAFRSSLNWRAKHGAVTRHLGVVHSDAGMRVPDRVLAMKDGLRIETASSVLARDMIQKHLGQFALVMRRDRLTSAATVAEYTNGLAGAVALAIAGGHGSKDDIVNATVAKFREYVDRDLAHLKT